MKDLLVQQGLMKGLYGKAKKPDTMTYAKWEEPDMKAVSSIRLCLADELMYDVMDDVSTTIVWLNLESRYTSKSLTNKLNLKQKLYELKMTEGVDLAQHNHMFNQIISDLLQIKIKFDDKNKVMMPLSYLLASYKYLVTTLLWEKETLKFAEILRVLLDHYQWKQNLSEISGEGLIVKGNQDRGRKKDKDHNSTR